MRQKARPDPKLHDPKLQTIEIAGDQSSVPGHMAELASDASEKDLSFGRMGSQSDELKVIQEAFLRIQDGSEWTRWCWQ